MLNRIFLFGLDDNLLVLIMLPDTDEYPMEDFIYRGSEFCVGRDDGAGVIVIQHWSVAE